MIRHNPSNREGLAELSNEDTLLLVRSTSGRVLKLISHAPLSLRKRARITHKVKQFLRDDAPEDLDI